VMVRCGILTYFMLCVCGKGVYVCMSARKVHGKVSCARSLCALASRGEFAARSALCALAVSHAVSVLSSRLLLLA
jgi:hypothetical protein